MIIVRTSQFSRTQPAGSSNTTERLLGVAATMAGFVAWIILSRNDLVLSHYDAKAHLVVARRVIDSITPGWQQIGAVWLPLPHLINFIPTQMDFFYRTGVFASLISVACFGVIAYAVARLVIALTGSRIGAATSTGLLALNPNLLYLQATPMTEPLLLATLSLGLLWLYEWIESGEPVVPRSLGWMLFAAMWTRYEAWPVIAAGIASTAYALWRRGTQPAVLVRRCLALAAWPAAAVVVFVINSRITVGAWFVSEGFFVPDPSYQGKAWKTLVSIWWGTHELSGYVSEAVALLAAGWIVLRALFKRASASHLVPVALFAAAALPLYAFYQGHPYRIRYMVCAVTACALFGGVAAGLARRMGVVVAAILLGSAVVESPPWDRNAPMLLEAQWDRPSSVGRRAVTACLARDYRGEKVLISMGSLAHYMQELSRSGFAIAEFVHEGNGLIWNLALETGPAPHAGWMVVEEVAEGGDVLAHRMRADPAFAHGMTRVCEGGGVALYRRSQLASRYLPNRAPIVN